MEPSHEEQELAALWMAEAQANPAPESLTTQAQWKHAMRTDPMYALGPLWEYNQPFRVWMEEQLYRPSVNARQP
jgi:hypothetical protein